MTPKKLRRKVLGFSIRSDATMPLQEMAGLLGAALGCSFAEGSYHKIPALTSELLGMRIVLFEWRGLAGVETFRLLGYVQDARFVEGLSEEDMDHFEVVKIDIGEAIVDLLDVREAGTWRIPSPAELEAELDHGDVVKERFR